MDKIDVISSSLVRMSNNGHQTSFSRTLELTPWDLKSLLRDPIQKGILFDNPNRSQQLPTTLIDHLKNSLSHTLAFFPPLSGRLGVTVCNSGDTSCFFIDCNDAGAEFTHAVAPGVSVSDVLGSKYVPDVVSCFFALNGTPNYEGVSKALLAVQVTELVDGLFIGCTANHVAMDGTSFWHFFNSWSEISRGATTISKVPGFDRWFPTNMSDGSFQICFQPSDQNPALPHPLLERVFNFSKDSLAKLKAKANSEARGSKISTLQVLSAHLWRNVVRSRHQQSVLNNLMKQEVHCAVLVGTRDRIPLQDGYFGNAVYVAKTVITAPELLSNGLGFAAQKINELVSQQTREAAVKFVEDWVETPIFPRKGVLNFVITSSPRFDVYGCDFGWGKPIAVRSGRGQKIDGRMTVYPAKEPGGIDVEVCLAPETLKAMEDDAEFMEAVTIQGIGF